MTSVKQIHIGNCTFTVPNVMVAFARLLVVMLLTVILFTMLFTANSSYAQQEESPKVSAELSLKQLLLMPEKLTQGHAKIESQCQKCHIHFDKSNQSPLCLDCHKEIKKDLSMKKGFHSNIALESIKECRSCHTDHKGRDFDITALDKDHFDHGMTDFTLKGSHKILDCADCHKPSDKNFRISLDAVQCTSCHDDPHDSHFSKALTRKLNPKSTTDVLQCSQCHNEKSWLVKNFDHNNTRFLLKAKHKALVCQSCHANDIAVEIGSECVNCHLSRDKHLQRFGRDCQSCHSEKGWDKTDYDHFKKTEFKLLGQHNKLSCDACHSTESYSKESYSTKRNQSSSVPLKGLLSLNKQEISQLTKKKFKHLQGKAPQVTCYGCHKSDDIHLNKNGRDCQQCHNNTDWQQTQFNHDEDTNFILQGIHKKLSCPACHLNETVKKVSVGKPSKLTAKDEVRVCFDCHELADPHNHLFQQKERKKTQQISSKSLDKNALESSPKWLTKNHTLGENCQNCHQQQQWQKQVSFNHDFTLFPLTGAHQLQICQSCHESSDFTIEAFSCNDCHSSDDFHQATLGKQCGSCHNSASWTSWQFNHQKQTEFSLTGAHTKLECEACHTTELVKPLFPAKACVACHQSDDAHQGAFGRNCQQCHNTDSFYDFKH